MKTNYKNKFFKGSVKNYKKTDGWFVGKFMEEKGFPILSTNRVEVAWKKLSRESKSKRHLHKKGLEINIVISGTLKVIVKNTVVTVSKGEFLVVHPYTKEEGLEAEDGTEVIVIKAPSVPNDKYEI